MNHHQLRRRSTPPVDGGQSLADLRALLERAEFTTRASKQRWASESFGRSGRDRSPPPRTSPMTMRLDDRKALPARRCSRSHSSRSFEPVTLESVRALGLLEAERDAVRAIARLLPHGDYYLASDHVAGEQSSDWVAGNHAPSVTLAKLAVRRPVDATLDLGSGCGIQALLAAKHSARVVVTDVNDARSPSPGSTQGWTKSTSSIAVRVTCSNPSRTSSFGLVAANPTYVISPTRPRVPDSGRPRDPLCREVVRVSPKSWKKAPSRHPRQLGA